MVAMTAHGAPLAAAADQTAAVGPGVAPRDLIEIRLLGTFHVRTADGSPVDPKAWRTVKNAELLRILALSAGDPVPVARILDALWPTVSETAGRASLRTAASHLRRVLGAEAIVRHADGIALQGAWVDVQAFTRLAEDARRAFSTSHWARTVATVRRADALYLGEIRLDTVDSDWAAAEREGVLSAYRRMLAEGAQAAAQAGWFGDALRFAARLLAVEPCSEQAFRTLMVAHAGLGDTGLALRAFERCRDVLSRELGVDPSPETREAYLNLLAERSLRRPPAFVGRAPQVAAAVSALTDPAGDRPQALLVSGAPGSGVTRFIEQVLTAVPTPVSRLVPEDAEQWQAWWAQTDDDGRRSGTGRERVVISARADDVETIRRRLRTGGWNLTEVVLPPLSGPEVAELAEAELGGEVSQGLVDGLMARGDGNPATTLGLLRSWTAAGRVDVTDRGACVLACTESPQPLGDAAHRGRGLLAKLAEALSAPEMRVLELVAAAGEVVPVDWLPGLAGDSDGRWAEAAASLLEDRGLLVCDERGYAVADADLRAAVAAYARPSIRRRLMRAAARLVGGDRVIDLDHATATLAPA